MNTPEQYRLLTKYFIKLFQESDLPGPVAAFLEQRASLIFLEKITGKISTHFNRLGTVLPIGPAQGMLRNIKQSFKSVLPDIEKEVVRIIELNEELLRPDLETEPYDILLKKATESERILESLFDKIIFEAEHIIFCHHLYSNLLSSFLSHKPQASFLSHKHQAELRDQIDAMWQRSDAFFTKIFDPLLDQRLMLLEQLRRARTLPHQQELLQKIYANQEAIQKRCQKSADITLKLLAQTTNKFFNNLKITLLEDLSFLQKKLLSPEKSRDIDLLKQHLRSFQSHHPYHKPESLKPFKNTYQHILLILNKINSDPSLLSLIEARESFLPRNQNSSMQNLIPENQGEPDDQPHPIILKNTEQESVHQLRKHK